MLALGRCELVAHPLDVALARGLVVSRRTHGRLESLAFGSFSSSLFLEPATFLRGSLSLALRVRDP